MNDKDLNSETGTTSSNPNILLTRIIQIRIYKTSQKKDWLILKLNDKKTVWDKKKNVAFDCILIRKAKILKHVFKKNSSKFAAKI